MQEIPRKILIIQTAFIGDAILASSMIESWASKYPNSLIDILVRKGNESLFLTNPLINEVLIWEKKKKKYFNLLRLIKKIRRSKYEAVFNVQRFFATGLITALSSAKIKQGFSSNPLSLFYSKSFEFDTSSGIHETDRNAQLLSPFYTEKAKRPRLYPTEKEDDSCLKYKTKAYQCLAPTSVWFTKQWPKENWIGLIQNLAANKDEFIYLLGAPDDFNACEEIRIEANCQNAINLAGKLSFMESASLMRDSKMNFVNDSAPMHISSSMNAPTTAIYCSTLPSFGFGPLSDNAKIIESKENLACRPCGLHGKAYCPEKHFKCSNSLDQLIN